MAIFYGTILRYPRGGVTTVAAAAAEQCDVYDVGLHLRVRNASLFPGLFVPLFSLTFVVELSVWGPLVS